MNYDHRPSMALVLINMRPFVSIFYTFPTSHFFIFINSGGVACLAPPDFNSLEIRKYGMSTLTSRGWQGGALARLFQRTYI